MITRFLFSAFLGASLLLDRANAQALPLAWVQRYDPESTVLQEGNAVATDSSGDVAEVSPPELSVWEADWDGEATVVAIVSRDHSGSGWYQGVVAQLDLAARTAGTVGSGIRQLTPSTQKSRLPWASVQTTAPPVAIASSGGSAKPSCREVSAVNRLSSSA